MTPMIQGSKVNTVRITGSSWIMCGQLLEPRCRQISYNEVNFAFACVLTPFTPKNIPKHPKTNNHYIHYQPFTQQRFQQMCHHCVTQPLARPAHPKVTREVAGGVGRCRWGWSTRCIPGALETGWVLGS